MKNFLLATIGGLVMTMGVAATNLPAAAAWDIEKAAAPYKGTELNVIFLDRPGYRAVIKLLPEFEKRTGIKVNYEIVPYENTREKQVLNFNSKGDLTMALVDLVWIG
jgi:multiple sugar transport system substrate-binding protein